MQFILNGQGHGDVADTLIANNFDTGALRPFVSENDPRTSLITLNSGKVNPETGKPVLNSFVSNAPATLRKDEWIMLDTAVIKVAKPRLKVVGDMRNAGLQYVIPNGMAKTVLEHEAQSDIGPAIVSMDGLREGDSDRPQYDLRGLPLPIIHKDFHFSARQIAVSRNGGTPLDTTNAELAARQVAEEAERMALGVSGAYSYAGYSIYGFTNFPTRMTKVLTAPSSANHPTTVNEVLAMRKQSVDNRYYGPWMLYYSPAWSAFMDEDYTQDIQQAWTLRSRLKQIDGITDVRQADYLTGTKLVLVQQTSDVARMVIGMEITTVQWESKGGMQKNFKVMAIMVPQLRGDYLNQTGIVDGTAP